MAFQLKDNIGQVLIYRFFDKTGVNLVPEKQAKKAVRTLNVEQCRKMGPIIDLFIFKQIVNDEVQYNMYLLLERGILYYPAIEKQKDPIVKMDETTASGGSFLKAGCADFNYQTNTLVVNVCKREGQKEEHFIRQIAF